LRILRASTRSKIMKFLVSATSPKSKGLLRRKDLEKKPSVKLP